jgi:hypothetical protein
MSHLSFSQKPIFSSAGVENVRQRKLLNHHRNSNRLCSHDGNTLAKQDEFEVRMQNLGAQQNSQIGQANADDQRVQAKLKAGNPEGQGDEEGRR